MSSHYITYTLTCGTRVHDTYASFTEINQRIADLQKALDNTPSTYSGTITVNQGFELCALNDYKALPSNTGELIDLCIQHGLPIAQYSEAPFYAQTMEQKFASTAFVIQTIKADIAQKKKAEENRLLDAQAVVDEFTTKFSRSVFAGQARWVNCYEASECYGGDEEGGWYYTCLTLVACFPLSHFQTFTPASFTDVEAKAREMVEAMGLECDRVMLEVLPAQSVTLSRPRYE
jgi:hypothetical protein